MSLNRSRLLWPTLFSVATALTGAASAQTATLTASQDATLIEDPAGAWANGAGANLFAGRVASIGNNLLRRGLVRFDLSSLPPQAQVQSVTVRLTQTRSRVAGSLPVALHRITQSWSEGPSATSTGIGVPSVNGDVTWFHRTKPSPLWTPPGGDYVADASASRVVGTALTAYVWPSTPALVADVQQWLNNPSTNHGWIVLGVEDGSISAKAFAARESLTVANRPTLTVQYTLPSSVDNDVPLPAWAISLLGAGLWLIARRVRS